MKITTTIKKSIAAALLSITAFASLSAVGAAPAQAATEVKFCFDWSSGADYATQPVYLYEWSASAGKWVHIRNGKTNSTGCGVFGSTNSNKYYIVQAYTYFGDTNMGWAVYSGWTPNYASPGNGRFDIGTGKVPLTQCIQGLYRSCNNMA